MIILQDIIYNHMLLIMAEKLANEPTASEASLVEPIVAWMG
jgi:hypothetical protein